MGAPKKRNYENNSLEEESGDYWDKYPAYFRASKSKNFLPTDKDLAWDIACATLKRLSRRHKKQARLIFYSIRPLMDSSSDRDDTPDIVRTLLGIISSRNEWEARRIYHSIRLLMVVEEMWENQRPSSLLLRYPEMNPVERWAYYGQHLYEIVFGLKTRKTHWPPVFNMQRRTLETALRESEYPEEGHDVTRLKWLHENGQTLDDQIRAIPCYCSYSFSIAEIPENVFLENAGSINKLVVAILSKLHSTEQENFKKLAKTPGIKNDGLPHIQILGSSSLNRSIQEIDEVTALPFPRFFPSRKYPLRPRHS